MANGKRIARLDDADLDALDRRLTIGVSKMTPGEQRKVRGSDGILSTSQVPLQEDLDNAKSEIIESYRKGVEIAAQAESRPLIPLFEAAKIELPPELKVDHEQMRYNFYWVEVTFSSLLAADQFPISAELELTLNDDVKDAARRTRPIRLFPGHKDIQLFKLDLEGAIGIDAGMNISIPMVKSDILPFGKVEADAKLKAGIVAGPYSFRFRKAAIEVKGTSDQNIRWRYNLHSELTGTNDFKSILVLKIAKEASSVEMAASLGIVPCKHKWIIFREILPQLKDNVTLAVELAPGGAMP